MRWHGNFNRRTITVPYFFRRGGMKFVTQVVVAANTFEPVPELVVLRRH